MVFDLTMDMEGDDELLDLFGGLSEAEADSEYWVGTIVEYAAAVELGTDRQQAQPYLAPAAREVQKKVEGRGLIDIALNAVMAGNDSLMGKGLQEIAFEVERRAKDKAPVDTGNLRASISTGQSLGGMRGTSRKNASFIGGKGQETTGQIASGPFGASDVSVIGSAF